MSAPPCRESLLKLSQLASTGTACSMEVTSCVSSGPLKIARSRTTIILSVLPPLNVRRLLYASCKTWKA